MNAILRTGKCSSTLRVVNHESETRATLRRSRGLTLLALLVATVGRAEVLWTEPEGDELTTIKLTVTPAAESVPAFKNRLTVRPIDEKPGNAALWYFRALAEEGKAFRDNVRQNREEFGEERYDEWNRPSSVPLKELPIEDAKRAFSRYDDELRNLQEASRRQTCDWDRGIESIRGPELITVLLPEMSQMRELARMLMLGTRLAIAEGRFADAIDLLRINYRAAQHTATEPFLVCQLVGIAMASLGNAAVLDLIAVPESPNLYWALTELPTPLVDLRESIRFELEIGRRIFPFLEDAETAAHPPDQWRILWAKALSDLTLMSNRPGPARNQVPMEFGVLGLALARYTHAKESLIAWGLDQQRVEQMPVGQVLAIYSKRIYDRISQSYEKAMLVDFTDANRFEQQAEQLIGDSRLLGEGPDREFLPIASLLLPAVQAARAAEIRQQREFAALRVIEALRMHAAENNGELPNKLTDVTCVPVPLNPATNGPFAYYREGKTAVLELPKSDGLHNAVRYEITIAP